MLANIEFSEDYVVSKRSIKVDYLILGMSISSPSIVEYVNCTSTGYVERVKCFHVQLRASARNEE